MSEDSRRTSKRRKASHKIARGVSTFSETSSSRQYEMTQSERENRPPVVFGTNLIEVEKMEVGGVKWAVYLYYAKSTGWLFASGTFLLYLLFQGFSVGSNIWLSQWSTDPLASTDTSVRDKYLAVYGVLGLFQALFIMAAVACVMVGTLMASSKLHSTMLERILRSPMHFFDTTPLGRILNRFSKDLDVMDVTIPMNLRMLCGQLYNVIGTIFIICFASPIFISVVVPIFIMYYFLQKFYVTTARQVKRMEAVTRSPIYSHFGETINGAPTIRSEIRHSS